MYSLDHSFYTDNYGAATYKYSLYKIPINKNENKKIHILIITVTVFLMDILDLFQKMN